MITFSTLSVSGPIYALGSSRGQLEEIIAAASLNGYLACSLVEALIHKTVEYRWPPCWICWRASCVFPEPPIPKSGNEVKWLTWQPNDLEEFPVDRLLHHLWEFSSRCSLCYLRGQNYNGHSLPICWEFGANDIRKDQDDLYLQIKQTQTKQPLNWCFRCGLLMQWYQPSRIGDQIIRAGIFGPVCMFSGIIVEAIAVSLTDNIFL